MNFKSTFSTFLLVISIFSFRSAFSLFYPLLFTNDTTKATGLTSGYNLHFKINLLDGTDKEFTLDPDQTYNPNVLLANIGSIEVSTVGAWPRAADSKLVIQDRTEISKQIPSKVSVKNINLIFNVQTTGIAFVTKKAQITYKLKITPETKEEESEEEAEEIPSFEPVDDSEEEEERQPTVKPTKEKPTIDFKNPYSAFGDRGAKIESLHNQAKKTFDRKHKSELIHQASELILDLQKPYNEQMINRKWKELIIQWHPDKHPGKEEFAKTVSQYINNARDTLKS